MGRSSDARERLLASAAQLIAARSYADVGVQELCEHAGVRKGSFYHFFPSKEALTLATLERQWACIRDELFPQALDPALEPGERVRRLVELQADKQLEAKSRSGHAPGCQFGNLAVELSTQSEPVRRRLDAIFREQQLALEKTLAESGDMTAEETAEAALAVLAYVQGLMMLAKLRNDPALARRLAARAVSLTLPLGEHELA